VSGRIAPTGGVTRLDLIGRAAELSVKLDAARARADALARDMEAAEGEAREAAAGAAAEREKAAGLVESGRAAGEVAAKAEAAAKAAASAASVACTRATHPFGLFGGAHAALTGRRDEKKEVK
jgi:hypothetical protein